jgi:hypothetical protein
MGVRMATSPVLEILIPVYHQQIGVIVLAGQMIERGANCV